MKHLIPAMLVASLVVLAVVALAPRPGSGDQALGAQIAAIAQLQAAGFEDTKRLHNEQLNALYRRYVEQSGGDSRAALLETFNRLAREAGLTTFDDFRWAMIEPLRHVNDPATGKQLPVPGALGTDLINPWLAAAGIAEGRPMHEQPMYDAATKALLEHIDFALIGQADPNLSLELLPAEWRENARLAYGRINPTNVFDGGFDHPLFYAVIREAARKFFREDHPQAKLDMAQLVTDESQGGLGVRSCLLCHERNHQSVYARLLAQGLYLEVKAKELAQAPPPAGAAGPSPAIDEARTAQRDAAVFLKSAQIVLDAFPDQIDAQAVRRSLAARSLQNTERLKPGYDQFCEQLEQLGCLKCHSTERRVASEKDPGRHGAFLLNPSAYHKTRNIQALLGVIDIENPAHSDLLEKAAGRVRHRGETDIKLNDAQVGQLRDGLIKWVEVFRQPG